MACECVTALCLVSWRVSLLVCHCAASLQGTAGLDTAGGSAIVVHGSNLGLVPSVVTLSYNGGSLGMTRRSYTASACVVLVGGVQISCTSVPGVGANYSVTVTVDGFASNASVDVVSYGPPIISSVEGTGATLAPAAGNACGRRLGYTRGL